MRITLTLKRRTALGVDDDSFSAQYVLAQSGIVSQDSITDPYGDSRATGTWSGGMLTVSDLPKYDDSGREWRYYAVETAVLDADGMDVSDHYQAVYRDKNNYVSTSVLAYSGGSVTNIRSTRELTLSKRVAGNMADKTRPFRFTITLATNDRRFNDAAECIRTDQNGHTTSEMLVFSLGTTHVMLQHDESITLLNLPGALNYTIEESTEDALGYRVEYTVNGSAASAGRIASGGLSANPHVAFTNTLDAIVPTGVSETSPIFPLGLIGFGLLLLLMARKRQHTKD